MASRCATVTHAGRLWRSSRIVLTTARRTNSREVRRGQSKAEGGKDEMRKSRCLCGRPVEYQELHSLFLAQHAVGSHVTFQYCRKGPHSLFPQTRKTQQVTEL